MTTTVESESNKPKPAIVEILLACFYGLVVLAALLIGFAAYWLGFLFSVLFVFLLVMAGAGTISRVLGACLKRLELRFICRPFDKTCRKHLLQCFNQWLFLVLAAMALRLAIVPAQCAPREYVSLQIMVWGATGFLMALALIPLKKVRLSTNSFFAIGWVFLAMELLRILLPVSNTEAVVLAPPFRGEWYIFQGGRSTLINHHYPIAAQRHALDIIKTKDGREVRGGAGGLESNPAFGQTLFAPADGTVAEVVNDRPDMPMGKTDLEQIVGNHLVLDIGQGKFVLMAHLKKGSVRVSPGETVRCGQAVAECGNSGNTSEPHLHLQVQSQADFNAANLRTSPIVFRDVLRVRSGRREQLREADVRRNDIVFGQETTVEAKP